MASVFNKIVSGEIPAFKVAENDEFLAFLDVFPIAKGHVLVIPKKEVDYIFDIDSVEYEALWSFSKKVAKGMKKVLPCKKIGVSVVGLEVPHAHIHLIPMNKVSDMDFSKEKLKFAEDEMMQIQQEIAKNI